MPYMKKLLFLILFSSCLYSQTINVRGVNLLYDKKKKSMTLTIPKELLNTKNEDELIEIVISKSYALAINGKISHPFFEFKGYKNDSISFSMLTKQSNCIVVEEYKIFYFPDVISDEYILQVSNLYEEKKRVNKQSQSLIIH
jgi:hypothetical protein